ncbi:SWIM zinc finger family protein [Kutzneria sp. CA-103260]|uniref:SWIM zinc finger family protein n=1 Tax=Kutzneria sp. CA-103260 TaxID=2802641 RepID=UPI001BA834DA|nr:hypothetical protein [Kutzneria sp. CA-103260]QUQ72209.1 hypothetical protein JJ691_99970 [Kutzneria sp. CA-103260]
MTTGLGSHFVAVLESLGMASRLRQGRLAARAGQVLSMSLSTSVVVAQVQDGSRTHRCRIGIKAFTKPEWASVEKALVSQALYTARLLSGEVPYEMFADLGLRLFPDDMRELAMDCTCDTWDMPCQHLAAVCHLLAEMFDQDPFQALAWRGRGREELLARLGDLRRGTQEPQSIKGFWRTRRPAAAELTEATTWPQADSAVAAPSGRPDAVLDELAPLPLELRGERIVDLLRPAYEAMTRRSAD